MWWHTHIGQKPVSSIHDPGHIGGRELLVMPRIHRPYGTHSRQRCTASMKDATFFCFNRKLAFDLGLRIPRYLVRDDDPVNAQARQLAFNPTLVLEERFRYIETNLPMNREIKLPRHTRRPDRTVTVDQMDAAPQGCTAET